MILIKHKELCDYLIKEIKKQAFSERITTLEVIGSLEKSALLNFLAEDTALGLFVHGGAYDEDGSNQPEAVSLVVVLGCRNFSGSTASLGTDDEFGLFDMLEDARSYFSNGTRFHGTNIAGVKLKSWKSLVSRDDLGVLGLNVEVVITRSVEPHSDI